jgi:hypothetical protein
MENKTIDNKPRCQGLPELWRVKEVAAERGISLQAALNLIRKNSSKWYEENAI